jgi:hypothetical protein
MCMSCLEEPHVGLQTASLWSARPVLDCLCLWRHRRSSDSLRRWISCACGGTVAARTACVDGAVVLLVLSLASMCMSGLNVSYVGLQTASLWSYWTACVYGRTVTAQTACVPSDCRKPAKTMRFKPFQVTENAETSYFTRVPSSPDPKFPGTQVPGSPELKFQVPRNLGFQVPGNSETSYFTRFPPSQGPKFQVPRNLGFQVPGNLEPSYFTRFLPTETSQTPNLQHRLRLPDLLTTGTPRPTKIRRFWSEIICIHIIVYWLK